MAVPINLPCANQPLAWLCSCWHLRWLHGAAWCAQGPARPGVAMQYHMAAVAATSPATSPTRGLHPQLFLLFSHSQAKPRSEALSGRVVHGAPATICPGQAVSAALDFSPAVRGPFQGLCLQTQGCPGAFITVSKGKISLQQRPCPAKPKDLRKPPLSHGIHLQQNASCWERDGSRETSMCAL